MRGEELLELIKTRRSVRKYKPDPVPLEMIETLMEAARWAPSGENAQPWRFVLVTDPEKRALLGELGGSGSGRRFKAEYVSGKMEKRLAKFKKESTRQRIYRRLISGEISSFMKDAPLVILGTARLDAWDPPYDLSAAAMNILLMAHSLGLGGCWLAAPIADVRDEEELKKIFKIPDNYAVFYALTIGFPNEEPKVRPRLSLKEIAFAEEFGNPADIGTDEEEVSK